MRITKDKIKGFTIHLLLDKDEKHYTNDMYLLVLYESGEMYQIDTRQNKWKKVKLPK